MLILELPFALALDNDPDVKMFFKIPDRFKIDTPIGSYNPDYTKNGRLDSAYHFLCRKRNHVLHSLNMTLYDSVMSIEFYSSYGTNVLENMISAREMEGKGDFEY